MSDIYNVEAAYEDSVSLIRNLDNKLLRDVGLHILTKYHDVIVNSVLTKPRHHCGKGELLVHLHNVALLCKHVGEFYSEADKHNPKPLKINKDLLIFCGLFHDLGKLNIWEGLDSYTMSQMLGHNISGSCYMLNLFNEVLRENGIEKYGYSQFEADMLLTEVLHCIAMHTSLSAGSKTNLMLEARILYYCDSMDAYMDLNFTPNDDGALEFVTGETIALSKFIKD